MFPEITKSFRILRRDPLKSDQEPANGTKKEASVALAPKLLTCFAGVLALAGCDPLDAPYSNPPAFATAAVEVDSDGRCYGRDVTPAVIETITEQVLVQPAQVSSDGTVLSPAAFRTVTRQVIVRERREVAFETVCPQVYTMEFVQTLQRSLKARGYYNGPVDGILNDRTAEAVRRFQRTIGHDSGLLALETARQLGLVALDREVLAAEG